jgi:predicted N-acyltransferase
MAAGSAMNVAVRGLQREAVRIRVLADITEADQAEWDALIQEDDLQASWRFIRLCQQSRVADAAYRHIMIHRGSHLVAVASLCRMEVSLDLLAGRPLQAAVEWGRRWYPKLLRVPVLFCGLPVSFGQSCFRVRAGEPVGELAELVSRQMELWATEDGATLLCFKEFTDAEVSPLAALSAGGYLKARSLPFCSLPIHWASFDDYTRAMRAGYRRQLSATLEVQERSGLTVSMVQDFGKHCDRLFALYEQVMDRAQAQLERLNKEFFTHLNADFAADSAAVLVQRGDELLAAGILLFGPHTTTFLLAGIDYRSHRSTQAYPVLVTSIVAAAIERGASRLELGQTSYALKSRLGAAALPRYIFLKARSPWLHRLLTSASPVLFPLQTVPERRVFKTMPGQPSSARPT